MSGLLHIIYLRFKRLKLEWKGNLNNCNYIRKKFSPGTEMKGVWALHGVGEYSIKTRQNVWGASKKYIQYSIDMRF